METALRMNFGEPFFNTRSDVGQSSDRQSIKSLPESNEFPIREPHTEITNQIDQ